ncbi:MAG: NTP transferase domain-containing protein, partial [Chloroflexota bacterium]|nr:NTP transferase domain-containing protein [Chloroflexota bacterium]
MVTEPGPIHGLVLAAGMSRRLGRPKQLLDVGGKPLVRHVVERCLASGLDAVWVVVGHEADGVRQALAGLD